MRIIKCIERVNMNQQTNGYCIWRIFINEKKHGLSDFLLTVKDAECINMQQLREFDYHLKQ